jgi:hypothetical protein
MCKLHIVGLFKLKVLLAEDRPGGSMRKLLTPLVLAVLLLAAVFGLLERARGQGPGEEVGQQVLQSETEGDSMRQISGPADLNAPQSPDIGFIDSPSATCYQPDRTEDACYINWYYLSVSADPNYMITMTVKLNEFGTIAHTQGFFQTSMYVPYNMLDHGFKVACGSLGAGGNDLLGNAYAYTVRARDSAGLKSANYGTVYCPAFTP